MVSVLVVVSFLPDIGFSPHHHQQPLALKYIIWPFIRDERVVIRFVNESENWVECRSEKESFMSLIQQTDRSNTWEYMHGNQSQA